MSAIDAVTLAIATCTVAALVFSIGAAALHFRRTTADPQNRFLDGLVVASYFGTVLTCALVAFTAAAQLRNVAIGVLVLWLASGVLINLERRPASTRNAGFPPFVVAVLGGWAVCVAVILGAVA